MTTAASIAGIAALAVLFLDYRLTVRQWKRTDDAA